MSRIHKSNKAVSVIGMIRERNAQNGKSKLVRIAQGLIESRSNRFFKSGICRIAKEK
jgi:DNA-binding protein